MVEVEGARSLVASCVHPVMEGMVVRTNTDRVRWTRKNIIELLVAAMTGIATCDRVQLELQRLAGLWCPEVRFPAASA